MNDHDDLNELPYLDDSGKTNTPSITYTSLTCCRC